jgi:hypothetical protein
MVAWLGFGLVYFGLGSLTHVFELLEMLSIFYPENKHENG